VNTSFQANQEQKKRGKGKKKAFFKEKKKGDWKEKKGERRGRPKSFQRKIT